MANQTFELGENIFEVSQMEMIERLAGLGCNVKDICHIIGVSRATFYRKLAIFPELGEALERGKAKAKGHLLGRLFQMACEGDLRALIFSLTVIHNAEATKFLPENSQGKTLEEMEKELEEIEKRKQWLKVTNPS